MNSGSICESFRSATAVPSRRGMRRTRRHSAGEKTILPEKKWFSLCSSMTSA